MDENIDLKSSSFINVTLAFWTNENGLAIAAQTSGDKQTRNQDLQLLDDIKSDEKRINSLFEANSQKAPTFQRLISNLLNDHSSGVSNESHLKSDDNRNVNVLGEVSNFTKKLLENITDVTNDTFLCSPTDVSTNDCIWRNDTRNGTYLDEGSSRPDRVYWALFLAVLPILALFGNILVILR